MGRLIMNMMIISADKARNNINVLMPSLEGLRIVW
jgi:hypothetical protein